MARDSRYTNFIEYLNYKIIYKRYAGLYFILCIDYNDNELSHLELIQLFVEILNDYFGNVSEMNLIYQFHEVYQIVDEMIIGGEICETSKKEILDNIASVKKLE